MRGDRAMSLNESLSYVSVMVRDESTKQVRLIPD